MRQYLDIPEHNVRCEYPLTELIMNQPHGVAEINETVRAVVTARAKQRPSEIPRGTCPINLPWMSAPLDVRVDMLPGKRTFDYERFLTEECDPRPKDIENPCEEITLKPVEAAEWSDDMKNPCEMIETRELKQHEVTTRTRNKNMTAHQVQMLYKQAGAHMAQRMRDAEAALIGPAVDMTEAMLFGCPSTVNKLEALLGHTFEELEARIKQQRDNPIDAMKARDRNTNLHPMDECGNYINPAAAAAQNEWFERDVAAKVEVNHKRMAFREEKEKQGRDLSAALAFDNTTGFTGIAHVDRLRGTM